MLQRLFRLLARYLDAVLGSAAEALGYLPYPPSMKTHRWNLLLVSAT
jgi:hypothetical protein